MISKMTGKDQGANRQTIRKTAKKNNVTPIIAQEWKQVARFRQHVSVPCVLWGIADPLLQSAICNWKTQRHRDFLLRGLAQRHMQCGCPTLGATARPATTELENAM
jgi:hypothetical protein